MRDCHANARTLAPIGATRPAFLAALLTASVMVALMLLGPAAHPSATISVNTLSDESTSGDGLCSVREAINNANAKTDTTGGDCAAGTGNDTINFSVSGTITLGSVLPAIQNTLTIDGAGQSVTIDGAKMFQVFVVNAGATLSLNDLTIENGSAPETAGAIFNSGTTVITNCTFFNNSALFGGAIDNDEGGTLNVTNSSFSGNHANAGGGAIENNFGFGGPSSAAVSDSTFSGNSGGIDGGAVFNSGVLTVANSTFTGNHAQLGGAIHSEFTLSVTNSTFFGNSASTGGSPCTGGSGGAIEGLATIANSTFLGNSACSQGGGISGRATIANSILAGNSINGSPQNCISAFVTDGGFNISDDSSCGFPPSFGANGRVLGDNVDPLVDPAGLKNNGGPTIGAPNNSAPTLTIALKPDSPAIDGVPSKLCPPTDERGLPRPDAEDTDLANPFCDIGAVESGATEASPEPTASATATVSATPSVTATPTASATATVTVTATPSPVPAMLIVSPNPLSFGKQKKGSTSREPVSVSAPSSNLVPVLVESFSVSGPGYTHDNFPKGACTLGESLSPGRVCRIWVDFSPAAKTRGLSDIGHLQVQTNAEAIKPAGGVVTLKGGGK